MRFLELAAADPEGLAIAAGEAGRTWASLLERIYRLGRLLRDEFGLAPGDHCAILMGNRVEYPELLLGCAVAGVWVTPLNCHLSAEEIEYVLADSGARLVFAAPGYEEKLPRGRRSLLAGPELESALAAVSSQPIALDGPVGGMMVYTSGTGGLPKGVRRFRAASARAALRSWGATGQLYGLDGSAPHLVTGPMYHAAPGLFALYDLINGAPLIMMPRWDARAALHLMSAHGVGHTHMVPTMFVRLLRLAEEERQAFDPSLLRLVLHGAAPVAPAIKKAMIQWWGDALVEYWGASEAGVFTLIGAKDWLAHPGSVGRAIPSFEVFAGDDAGNILPPGEVGLLYCRHRTGPDAFEYHNDPAKTAAAFVARGVFTVGDLGRVDEDGWVYLEGRRTDLILSGGVNVYPAEIQSVFLEHPAVCDVAVFGVEDEEWGERVCALVELVDGLVPNEALAAELGAYARGRLAAYKVPRKIDFTAALPRQPNGKIRLQEIRKIAQSPS
jgi:long-chain acyl-CoA synthetase